ncbi:MAG TPA: GntR family transcriptional regulator [Solirubrobacterales bacterium]|nr:GntR family transcriptional regulator [Solirubrobacterales bacterium]
MKNEDRQGPVSRRVHETLRRDILDGKLEIGAPLPSERSLAEQFGVNRHAIREALKRLEQAGLIRITHGGATRVLDWRDTGGLQVLLDLLDDTFDPPSEIARSVIEMRASIGVDAARHCVGRASEEQRLAVRDFAFAAADLVGAGDDEALDLAFATLWQAIVIGSGNIAYRLSLNSLMQALAANGDLADRIRPEDSDGIRALGEAIARGDETASIEAARILLEPDISAF